MYNQEPEKVIAQLARKIAQLRKKRNLTQEKLAELIDVGREHLSKVETNKRRFSIEKLVIIANVLEVQVRDLFTFDD